MVFFRRKDKAAAKGNGADNGSTNGNTAPATEASHLLSSDVEDPLKIQVPPPISPLKQESPRFSLSDTVQARLQSKYKRDVVYNEEDHLSVMFQLYGSVYVVPYIHRTSTAPARVFGNA